MADCIFCSIVQGDIPNHTVYEDDDVLAFLDIHPTTDGFTLVIPKKHADFVWDLSGEDYAHLMSVSKKVAGRISNVLQPSRVGMQIEGLDVKHAHVKIFGFETGEEFRRAADMSDEPDHDQLAKLAEKLRF